MNLKPRIPRPELAGNGRQSEKAYYKVDVDDG